VTTVITSKPVPKIGNIYVVILDLVGVELVSAPSFSSPTEVVELLLSYPPGGRQATTAQKGDHVLLLDTMLESSIIPSTKADNGLFKFLHIKENKKFFMRLTPAVRSPHDNWKARANHTFYMYFVSLEDHCKMINSSGV